MSYFRLKKGFRGEYSEEGTSKFEAFGFPQDQEVQVYLFVDMIEREIRVCKELQCSKLTAKLNFTEIALNRIFVCANLYNRGDWLELKRHKIISKEELEVLAPLPSHFEYLDQELKD